MRFYKFIWILSLSGIAMNLLAATDRLNFAHTKKKDTSKFDICVDNNFWFPYTFVYKGKPVGLHKDIVQEATSRLGYQVTYHTKRWKQCLRDAKLGRVDGILSISYSSKRKSYISYPEDAPLEDVSRWRLSQVAYYLVTPIRDPYGELNLFSYKGDLEAIPKPIRIEDGYSVGNYLKAKGLSISEGETTIENFRSLVNSQLGSLISVHETVQALKKKPPFRGKIYLHREPIISKSYFLGFSKNSKLSRKAQRKVWRSIKESREDRDFMAKSLKTYGFES